MIGRHDHHYWVGAIAPRQQGRQRQGRRRIAPGRLKYDGSFTPLLTKLLGHGKTMVLVADQQRRLNAGQAIQPANRQLQHRFAANQR